MSDEYHPIDGEGERGAGLPVTVTNSKANGSALAKRRLRLSMRKEWDKSAGGPLETMEDS